MTEVEEGGSSGIVGGCVGGATGRGDVGRRGGVGDVEGEVSREGSA